MNNHLIIWGLSLILISACDSKSAGNEKEKPAQQSATFTVSGVVAISQSTNVLLTSTGDVIAGEQIDLMSEVSGRIIKIGFQEGREVTKGQLLIKLNDDELQASFSRARQEIQLLKDQVGRQEQLLDIKGISQEAYDIAQNNLLVKQSEIQILQAQIDQTEIRAPFGGTVGLKYVSEGANITPATRIASLQSVKPVKIDFSVPERYSPRIKVGQKIFFTISSLPDTLEAEIYAVEPRIEASSRSLQIRALYPNTDDHLRPGAFANVHIRLPEAGSVIEIPANALIPALQGAKVLLSKNGKVKEQNIRIGQRFENTVEVKEGLQEGDTIITSGILQLKPGMPVNVTIQKSAPSSNIIKTPGA